MLGDIGEIILRTILMYFIIIITFRLMGKREIGELNLLDIVVFIMIGEMAVFLIEDPKESLLHGIVPIGLLMVVQRFTAWLSLKNEKFRFWFEGKPSVIISKGKIDEQEMRKQRYNFNDLLQQLRESGTKSVQDVEFAILEPSGKLSIFEKTYTKQKALSPNGYVLPLIMDGRVQVQALHQLEKTEEWLKNKLAQKGYDSIKGISFCSMDANGDWFIDINDQV